MTTVCITNYLPDVHSCTYRDSHTDECDGFEYAWIAKRDQEEATGKDCGGCQPKKAWIGYVCRGCFAGIVAASSGAPGLIEALGNFDRVKSADAEGRGSGALGYVPLTAIRLAVDELRRHIAARGTLTPEAWVSERSGAESAVRFARAYTAAVRSFPLQEDKHPLKRTHCPECKQLTLEWHPAPLVGMKVVVKCRDPKCGREIDEDKLDDVSYIEDLRPARRKAA